MDYNIKMLCTKCRSCSVYGNGVLQMSCSFYCPVGSPPYVIDSGHISAAVKEDMTVVIILSVSRDGLDTHMHKIHTHLVTITVLK